jgi:hypothetical protein
VWVEPGISLSRSAADSHSNTTRRADYTLHDDHDPEPKRRGELGPTAEAVGAMSRYNDELRGGAAQVRALLGC